MLPKKKFGNKLVKRLVKQLVKQINYLDMKNKRRNDSHQPFLKIFGGSKKNFVVCKKFVWFEKILG